MNRAGWSRLLLPAILLAAGVQAQDSAPSGAKAQSGPAPAAAPIIPSLRVVGDAPPPQAAPKKKHHRKPRKHGTPKKVDGKLRCRAAAPPAP